MRTHSTTTEDAHALSTDNVLHHLFWHFGNAMDIVLALHLEYNKICNEVKARAKNIL